MFALFSSFNFLLVCLLQSCHKRGVEVYNVFNSNDLTLQGLPLLHSSFITVHTLNYNSSFLLDNFSFIISKMLYHTSSKLNIVNFPRVLPPGPPLNPLRGSQCLQTPSFILFSNSCKTSFQALALKIFKNFTWDVFIINTFLNVYN